MNSKLLVPRLRDHAYNKSWPEGLLYEAAVRIEELEVELRRAHKVISDTTDTSAYRRITELECENSLLKRAVTHLNVEIKSLKREVECQNSMLRVAYDSTETGIPYERWENNVRESCDV